MKKFLYLLISLLFLACGEDEISATDSFFKIYDDSNFELSYNPIDVVETVDGFIILSGTELNNTDFMGVELIKVDESGEFRTNQNLSNYVIPVGDMHLIDSISYFFAMNPTTLEAVLIGVNPQLEIQVEQTVGGLNYPLASSINSNNELILLSYDPVGLASQISVIGTDGSFVGGASYSIGPGDDVLEDIVNHYLNAGERPLPFFCGELSSGNYFFNGFYNFSFSLVFTDFSAAPNGVVQGQSTNAGVSAFLPLSGGTFALAGYQFTDNYQLASTGVSTTGNSSSVDLYPGNMAELKSYTPSDIITYTSGSTDYTVFAAETKGRQILLMFYDAASGEVAGLHHVGFINPFTFSSVKVTSDNALIVLGTTFVAGRFERITLSKLSSSEITSIIN